MRKTLISLITIAVLAISMNMASAQKGHHGGGGGGGAAAVRGGGGGGIPTFSGGGRGGGGPSPSFSAPSGTVGGYSRSIGGYNRGSIVHAPRLNSGIVQRQYQATRQQRLSPQVLQRTPLQQQTSRIYTQRRIQTLGAHHRRYHHRRRGYAYYYGGWWYAFPWWLESYSDYDYWSSVCASQWGYYTPGYYSCMAYYGFY